MNILNKIKNSWNHKESVKQNVLRFSNEQEQRQRKIKKLYPLFIGLFIIACLVFPINPLVGLSLIIGGVTFGSEYIFNNATTYDKSVLSIDSTHFVVAYRDYGNSNYGTCIIGTISNGNEISYGSEYVFNSGDTRQISMSLIDSTHFVVAYSDGGNSNYGTCIIGTISNGNEISYGSEYVFNSGTSQYISTALIDSTHFVVSYQDFGNSSYGTCIIGTISNGNEISYGSEYVFKSGAITYTSTALIDSTHFVVAYNDDGGTKNGTSIIATISNGNEISYGDNYVFNSGAIYYPSIALIDSTHFVVAYRDYSASNRGTCIIGTIANDDEISFGSKYNFTEVRADYISALKISSNEVVISFQDYTDNKYYGTSIIATISNGNEISYGDKYVFNSASSHYMYSSLLSSTSFVVVYSDRGNSDKGTAVIGNLSSATPSSNFFLFFD